MKEVSHSEIVTAVRNAEGEIFIHTNAGDFCCNPSDETRQRMLDDQASRAALEEAAVENAAAEEARRAALTPEEREAEDAEAAERAERLTEAAAANAALNEANAATTDGGGN